MSGCLVGAWYWKLLGGFEPREDIELMRHHRRGKTHVGLTFASMVFLRCSE